MREWVDNQAPHRAGPLYSPGTCGCCCCLSFFQPKTRLLQAPLVMAWTETMVIFTFTSDTPPVSTCRQKHHLAMLYAYVLAHVGPYMYLRHNIARHCAVWVCLTSLTVAMATTSHSRCGKQHRTLTKPYLHSDQPHAPHKQRKRSLQMPVHATQNEDTEQHSTQDMQHTA